LRKEVERLKTEKENLFKTGAYTKEDRVIVLIQKAIDMNAQKLTDLLKKEKPKPTKHKQKAKR
jgi:hypothetical protein